MKDYDKSKKSSYLKFCDANNLYGWPMSQKLPVNNFEWIEDTFQFNEDFIKNIMKKVMNDIFSNDLTLLTERMKLERVKKLVTNLHDKTEYVIHITNLKQALNHGLILKKVHRVIKFHQKAWLKPYIEMNTKLRQKSKNNIEKDVFKLMNNTVLNKPVYLGLSILDVKPKYGENAKLCYMDTDAFIVHVKQMLFTKILRKMLKQDITIQILK